MGKRKYSESGETQPEEVTEPNPKDDIDTKSKRQKQTKNLSYDIKHFRKELASKTGQITVLTQFLQVCLDPDSDSDYIMEYLKAGGNSHEILRQVGTDSKKNITLATPAFHLFHFIIMKVQSSMPHMIAITEEACRYFLNNFVSTVEIMISENSGPRHRKIILKLLTSMVTLNPDLGIEVLNQAPLTPKHLQYILEKPNYKEKDNVRTSFVHFMTSFLVDGHLPLIKALLEKQGLLALVIPGLIHDEAEAVLMFLNIMKKNVIENPLISKSLKLKTFSHNTLHQLFKLYFWKGPSESLQNAELRSEVTQLLSEILLILFTSSKLGLYFKDPLLGTTDSNKNQNLYKALLTLKRPWENQEQCRVILEIVYKCTDLHRAVVTLIEQNFEPQHSPMWERTVEFIGKLYCKLKPEDMVSHLSKLNTIQVANLIRFHTLPIPFLKQIQSCLSKEDKTLAIYCLKVLVNMLSSLRRYMQLLEMENNTANFMELKNKLEYFVPKHLPSPSNIVLLIQNILSDEISDTKNEYTLSKIDKTESLILAIDVLLLYSDIHTAFFENLEGNLNINEILQFASTVENPNIPQVKFKTVSLWLTLDNSAVTIANPKFKELLKITLDVYTSDGELWIDAKNTIYRFIKGTGIFDTNEDEIHIFLHVLRNCKVEPQIISNVIEYILENSKDLVEIVRTQISQHEGGGQNSESNLEAIFEKLAAGKYDDEKYVDLNTPSPFVVGCVQLIQKDKVYKKSLKHFLSIYVSNLLHMNFSPELTASLISNAKLDVANYLTSWITEPVVLDSANCGNDECLELISKCILNAEDLKLQDIFRFIKETIIEEADFIFSETPYKICEKDVDSSAILIWMKYIMFVTVQLANLNSLTKEKQEKILIIFKFLLDLCKKLHKLDLFRNVVLNMIESQKFIKIFSPIHTKNESFNLASEIVVEVIAQNTQLLEHLDKYLIAIKSLQKKNFVEIRNTFNKINKKKNINCCKTVNILNVISMSRQDDFNILDQSFSIENQYFIRDDKEPSLVLEVIAAIVKKYAQSVTLNIPQNKIKQIMNKYTDLITDKSLTCNLVSVENVLIEYFQNKPNQVRNIPSSTFEQFFKANVINKTTSALAALLLKFNNSFCSIFKEQLKNPSILSQRELTLPLGTALLTHKKFVLDNNELLNSIYNEYKTNILKSLEKPQKMGQVYISNGDFILKLFIECSDIKDCEAILNKCHKFECVELSHVKLYQATFLKVITQSEKIKQGYLCNYYLTMLNLLTMAMKDPKHAETIEIMIKSIEDTLNDSSENFQKVIENALWQNFCKSVLKTSLKSKSDDELYFNMGPTLLSLLTKLINIFYQHNHDDIVNLFDMVTSHSEFLKVILSNSLEIKTALIEFLFALIRKNSSVMKQQQIPVYLSAYGASMSHCDRLILSLVYYYEEKGLPVNEYKPYLWGESAANYYAVRKNRAASLWSQPTPNHIVNIFDKDTVVRTIERMSVLEKMNYTYENKQSYKTLFENIMKDGLFDMNKTADIETKIKNNILTSKYDRLLHNLNDDLPNITHRGEDADIYDPSFILPLLSHILAPGSIASCFKILRKGLMSVPVMCLSSNCPQMRAAAYHVLHRYTLLLETETKHKNDKLILSDFISTLRRSLNTAILNNEENNNGLKNPKLPAIDALYLAKALLISTASFEPVFKPINNFLIAKQNVDLTTVPDFLSLFHDSDIEAVERRLWILKVIQDGTRTMTDVNVIFKTMCLKMILDFYSSVLCDNKVKVQILGVIESLVCVPRACEILIEGYSLIAWLNFVVAQMKDDKLIFNGIVRIIKGILTSTSLNNFSKSVKLYKNKNVFDLKIDRELEKEVLMVLNNVASRVHNFDSEDYLVYLSALNLLSKKSLKHASKNEILDLIGRAVVLTESSYSNSWMSKAVASANPDLLNSNLMKYCIDDDKEIIEQLVVLVKAYLS